MVVMLQKQWLEVSKSVLFTEQSPYFVFVVGIAIVELNGFQLCKLLYQGFIDNKLLVAVLAWCFVFMQTDTFLQKCCHLKMWVAKQGRYTNDGRQHLGI